MVYRMSRGKHFRGQRGGSFGRRGGFQRKFDNGNDDEERVSYI